LLHCNKKYATRDAVVFRRPHGRGSGMHIFYCTPALKMVSDRRGLPFGGGQRFGIFIQLFQKDKPYIRRVATIKTGGLNTGIFIAMG